MSNRKKHPRCYVVSMRVSDEEKTALEEITRRSCLTISDLMREAMQRYTPMLESHVNQG